MIVFSEKGEIANFPFLYILSKKTFSVETKMSNSTRTLMVYRYNAQFLQTGPILVKNLATFAARNLKGGQAVKYLV